MIPISYNYMQAEGGSSRPTLEVEATWLLCPDSRA
jgi:hypothetical protein